MPKNIFPLDNSKKFTEQKLVGHNRWHPDIPAAARVKPGDVFRADCREWFDGAIKNDDSADDIRHAPLPGVHVRLSELVAELPDRHLVRESVVTPWEQKGTVMRTLMERSGDREVVLVDGVKVRHDGGWVLAWPDPEEPVTNVWAEADSDLAARHLAEEYVRRIRQMIR